MFNYRTMFYLSWIYNVVMTVVSVNVVRHDISSAVITHPILHWSLFTYCALTIISVIVTMAVIISIAVCSIMFCNKELRQRQLNTVVAYFKADPFYMSKMYR